MSTIGLGSGAVAAGPRDPPTGWSGGALGSGTVGPLEGVKVVELGVWVAGPGAGGVLADWGAEVVKVEPPEGDPMRRLFALLSGHGQPASPPFDLDNRGKKSVVADLATDAGRAAALELIADSDVFLTNLRPAAVERFGLGPDTVMATNPQLVYASVSGYGSTGPDVDRAGYDVGAFWARSGIAATLNPPDHDPPMIRSGMGDHVTAMTLVAGISAALLARERTGKGQLVETSLLRTGIWCMGWDLGIQLRFDKLLATGPRTEAPNPIANSYRCGDGKWFWLLGIEADRHWPTLLAAIDRTDLADDERFATSRARRKNAAALIEVLDQAFGSADRVHWTERFDRHDVWWAPINTAADVVIDPQAIEAGAFVDVPEGEGAEAHRAVNTPVDFDGRTTRPNRGVPALGEHTAH